MSRSVAAGSQISLYIEIYSTDVDGNIHLRDPDATPVISIYDQFSDPRFLTDSELVTNALLYRATASRITTGIYKYDYTPSSSAITGWWFDRWEVTIDGIDSVAIMQFLVTGTDIGTTPLNNNYVVEVTLDDSISDIDGNTLGEDYVFYFLTTFDPMYSDPTLLRLYVGNWVSSVPDETLTLMLYESSKLADMLTPTGCSKDTYYQQARTKFVTYDAALRLLSIPVNAGGGMTKSLGDLFVKREGNGFKDILSNLLTDRDEWLRVVNSCGQLVPGESFGPIWAIKGVYDPDRRKVGRRWDTVSVNDIPAANDKHIANGRRLYSYYYGGSLSGSNKSIKDEILD